ncbi:MAG TPA: hypothetical protein VGP93_10160 [Polyangiaceae bacterium]|nr:hypothetical protein [Polyangiaceae bacterium]
MSKVRLRGVLAQAAAIAALGCSRPEVPDARDAARAYAEAVNRGDHQAVYALLTRDSRRDYGVEGTRRLLADAKQELTRQGAALLQPGTRVDAVAHYQLLDGESAELVLTEHGFRLSAAGTFPAAARTPAQALEELRRALSRRSYAAVIRLLSSDAQGTLESEVRSVVKGLENAQTLDVKVEGDAATVEVPGGHRITLKRESGIWRVDNVE